MIKGTATAGAQEFAAGVKWTARFVEARPSVPIQGCLLLTLDAGSLSIVSFNESVTARGVVTVDGDGDGQVAVSGRLLADLAGTFGNAPVTIAGSPEALILSAGRTQVTLPTMDPADFPAPPTAPRVIGKARGDDFATAVRRAGAARSINEKQPAATHCLHLSFGAGSATATATDTLRAASASMDYEGETGAGLVGAQAVLDVAGSLEGTEDVWVAMDGNLIGLATPTRAVLLRQIKEPFKQDQIEALFASARKQPDRACLHVADLAVPVKQAMLVQTKEQPVRLHFMPGSITITGEAKELKQGSDGNIDAVYDGPECSFWINPKYLGLATASAPGEAIDLTFSAGRANTTGRPSPILMTSDADPTWRHAIMPIRPPRN